MAFLVVSSQTRTYQDADYFLRFFVINRDTINLFQLVSDMYQPWMQQRAVHNKRSKEETTVYSV